MRSVAFSATPTLVLSSAAVGLDGCFPLLLADEAVPGLLRAPTGVDGTIFTAPRGVSRRFPRLLALGFFGDDVGVFGEGSAAPSAPRHGSGA